MGVGHVPCLGCPVIFQRSLVSHGSPSITWSSQSIPSSLNQYCVCSSAIVPKHPCPRAVCLVKKLQSSRHGSKHGFVLMAITSIASEVETPGTLLCFQLMQQIEEEDQDQPSNREQVEEASIASRAVDLLLSTVDTTPEKEKLRRQRIAQSNKGRVPWNKGRHHSTETIARIQEKTREAMNKPQVREKLRQNGRPQSFESKEKIRCKLKNVWNRKRMNMFIEKMCIGEWREAIAEAARVGGLDDDELEWDTYKNLKHQIRLQQLAAAKQDRLQLKQEMRALKKAMRGPGYTMEHRMKISEAIRAKWEDPEYRRKTLASMHKRTGHYGAARVKLTPPKEHGDRLTADESFIAEVLADEDDQNLQRASAAGQFKTPPHVILPRAPHQSKTTFSSEGERDFKRRAEASHTDLNYPKVRVSEVASNSLGSHTSQESDKPSIDSPACASYIDPLASQKLEKIKQLRESRLQMESQRREASDRARLLMVEAERAALALESAAQTDKVALATLNKTRRLLAEAARAIQMAESEKINTSLSALLTTSGYINDMLMKGSFSSPAASPPTPKQQSITGTQKSLGSSNKVNASRVHHFSLDSTQSHQLEMGMMSTVATRESADTESTSTLDSSSFSGLLAREMCLLTGHQKQQQQQKNTQTATALGSGRIKVKKWYKDDDGLMDEMGGKR